jgi:hypothetical protein
MVDGVDELLEELAMPPQAVGNKRAAARIAMRLVAVR